MSASLFSGDVVNRRSAVVTNIGLDYRDSFRGLRAGRAQMVLSQNKTSFIFYGRIMMHLRGIQWLTPGTSVEQANTILTT
jgi:hypothetical protein